jgi:hypothetical protein
MQRRYRLFAACVTVVLVVSAGLTTARLSAASVAVPVGGTFSITPARRYVVARPPASLVPTTVANTTDGTLRVQVFPVLLGQAPSGAFTFEPSASALAAARGVLGVGPTSFTLTPGASRRVGLRWRRLPSHARIANVGVVYQATPTGGAGAVRIVERLLGVDVLRLPGHYRRSGRLLGVHLAQISPGVLQVGLSVRNTGQAVAGPSRLVLTVRGRSGTLLVNRSVEGDIVLPGAIRIFVLDVDRRLPAGAYVARAHMTFGSSHGQGAAAPFELVGPDELAASRLALGPLVARGSVGGSAEVSAALRNTGTAAGRTTIDLDLYRLTGGIPGARPIASRQLAIDSLAPRASHRLRSGLGRLRAGTYRLVASYEDSTGTPQKLVADFQAERALGTIALLRGFSTEHALLIPALLLLLCIGSVTLLLVRERRLKHALAIAERTREEKGNRRLR